MKAQPSQVISVFGGRWDRERSTLVTNWQRYMQISRAIGRQDFVAAAASCESVLVEHPDDTFALGLLAHCHSWLGHTDQALDAAAKALARTPNDFLALQLAASLCAQREDHARAKGFVIRALAADPHAYDAPEWVVLLIRALVRLPVVRRFVRPEAADELDPAKKQRELDEWRGWAEQYLAWVDAVEHSP